MSRPFSSQNRSRAETHFSKRLIFGYERKCGFWDMGLNDCGFERQVATKQHNQSIWGFTDTSKRANIHNSRGVLYGDIS